MRNLVQKGLVVGAVAAAVVLVALPYGTSAVLTTVTTCAPELSAAQCDDRIGAEQSVSTSAEVGVSCGPALLVVLPPSYELSHAGVGGTVTDASVSNPCLPRNTLRLIAAGSLIGLGIVSIRRMRRGAAPSYAATLGLAGALLVFVAGTVPFQATTTTAHVAVTTPADPSPAPSGYETVVRTCTILGFEGDASQSTESCEGWHGLPRTVLLASMILVGGVALLVAQSGEQAARRRSEAAADRATH